MTTPAPGPCVPCGGGTGGCNPACAGDGLTVNPTTGAYDVDPGDLISDDAGNIVRLGSDGKVMLSCTDVATCGGGSGTVVTGGTGTVVTPVPGGYQVTAPPSAAPGNIVTTGPDGLALVTCADVAACVPPTVVEAGPGVILTGNGVDPTPYNISALSGSAGNVLTEGADGGVYLDCADVLACGGGGGTPTTVTAGPGVDVTGDPVAGYTVSAPPSTDPGNLITLGSDGNVMLDCADLAPCGGTGTPTTVTAGPGVDVTGDPTVGYTVSAPPSLDAGNLLTLGTDGNMIVDCADVAGCIVVQGDPATPEVAVTNPTPGTFIVTHPPLITPRARVRSPDAIQVPERVPGGEPVTMGIVTYDRGGMFNPAQPTRLTVPAGWAGIYSMGGNVQYRPEIDDTLEGFRAAFIRLNGTTIIAYQQQRQVISVEDSTLININTDYELAAGDYIEFMLQQFNGQSAKPIPVWSVAEFTAVMWLTFINR